MMLMNVFDMGFGESILLKSDNASLLVDCGSKTKRNVELQVSSIRRNINKQGTINFMLTHFPALYNFYAASEVDEASLHKA